LRDLGVVGLGMVDSAVVLEELGRVVCRAPFASAVAVTGLGVEPGVPTALAVYEEGCRYAWSAPSTSARQSGDGWTLDGMKVRVIDAPVASTFVVVATADDGVGAFLTSEASVDADCSVDETRSSGRVVLRGAPAQRLEADAAAIGRMLDRLGVALVVDGVGAAARALELAVEYAKERVQFDKPIGSFQAVQHLCADMLKVVELGRAAAYYACWALDEASPGEARRAALLAQAFAASAFPQLGADAIQVFGGIGFTWEHDIHLYYKRLLSMSVATGTADSHLGELAALTID
jgi:alkylation response protein AidB-like acyl-CoA dehydrogenase